MNVRKARENLGRVRTCIQRGEFPQALHLVCDSLRDCGAQPAPMDLRGAFRTALADICSAPEYKQRYNKPLGYTAGKEKAILDFLQRLLSLVGGAAEEEEPYEEALQRKLSLDRCINDGKTFVAQGKFSDADDCFTEALKYYKNEIAAFGIMARAMMEAGQYVRALGYVRKGLEIQGNNEDLLQLQATCNKMRTRAGK